MVIIAVIGTIIVSGCLYFYNSLLNSESVLDVKNVEEQQEELLSKKEFKDLPEVMTLEQQVKELDGKEANISSTGDNSADSDNNSETKAKVPTQKEIESKLKGKLSSLQSEYEGRLLGLIASAKKEYNQIKSGKKSGSTKALAEKYINLAEGLEVECDARVYASIAYATNELKEYGYDTHFAEQTRKFYQQTKKERRKQLISKI